MHGEMLLRDTTTFQSYVICYRRQYEVSMPTMEVVNKAFIPARPFILMILLVLHHIGP